MGWLVVFLDDVGGYGVERESERRVGWGGGMKGEMDGWTYDGAWGLMYVVKSEASGAHGSIYDATIPANDTTDAALTAVDDAAPSTTTTTDCACACANCFPPHPAAMAKATRAGIHAYRS